MVEPGMRTFDHPTILAQTTAMLGPALGDHGLDTAFAQRATMSGGIVAAIGVDDAGLLKRSATNAANGWNRINERQQLRDVVGVRASQDRNERNAVGVYEDVVLGTGSRAIGGVRASFSPAPTARTDDESTAAYDRSIWPAARNLS
ncbi:transposase, partial [Burkholderia glumae]